MKKVLSLALALAMLTILCACGVDYTTIDTSTPEGLAEKYVYAVFAGDGAAIHDLTMDKYEVARKIESGFFEDEAGCIADCMQEATEKLADYKEEFGDDVEISDFEINEQHTYSAEEQALLIKHLEDGKIYPEGAVSDIRTLKVGFKVKGSKRDTTMHFEQSIAKIDGRWYWGITNINATHDGVLGFIEQLKAQ